jgi:hypothetical protein
MINLLFFSVNIRIYLSLLSNIFHYFSIVIGFFNRIIPNIVTTAPIAIAARNIGALSIIPTTKIPPCGALEPHPNAIETAPATAEPTIDGGIMRRGSDAANGIAPSVINDSPII